jgi:hypothetical protein
MNIIRLFPVIFSFLILSAHFSRIDILIFSILCLLLPLVLIIKKSWVVKLVQTLLVLGSFEWIRSIFNYVIERQSIGEPYIKLVIILGLVAVFTGLSTLVFKNHFLKERYKL